MWQTPEGYQWLIRLVVATLHTFALKRGVGMETISEFFARLHLETQIGCSPSALRSLMQKLEVILVEMGHRWEQEGIESGEVREIVGGVETPALANLRKTIIDDRELSKGVLPCKSALHLVAESVQATIKPAKHPLRER